MKRPAWSFPALFGRVTMVLLSAMAPLHSAAQEHSSLPDSIYHQVVRFSPDGSLMAWSERQTHTGAKDSWTIWLAPTDGSQRLRVTEGDPFFVFHPDGSRIVYSKNAKGRSELFHIRIDGQDDRPITSDGFGSSHPWVAPDGRTIYFVTREKGSGDIARIDISGSDRRVLTRSAADDLLPSLSPDGRLITFYRSSGSGRDQIHLMNPDGTQERALTDGTGHHFFPAWTPDDYVSWITDSDKGQRLIRTSPTTLLRPLDKEASGVQWQVFSPDGRRMATIRGHWPVTWIEISDASGQNARRVVN